MSAADTRLHLEITALSPSNPLHSVLRVPAGAAANPS